MKVALWTLFSTIFLLLIAPSGTPNQSELIKVVDHTLLIYIGIGMFVFFVLMLIFLPIFYVGWLSPGNFDEKKEKLKVQNEARLTLAQIIGGAIILCGLFFTYQTYNLNIKQLELSEEGQITERFTKAVELIGSSETEVRTAGLYALERISKDSRKDYWTIVEIIAAYVRERSSKVETEKQALSKRAGALPKSAQQENTPSDIKAALTILSNRADKKHPEGKKLDLRKAILKEVDLSDLDLSDTNFSGADLSGSILYGTKLINSQFIGAIMKGIKVSGATDLTNAKFVGADLGEAQLDELKFETADFRGAKLSEISDLTYEQLQKSLINGDTELPKHLKEKQKELIDLTQARLEEIKKKETTTPLP